MISNTSSILLNIKVGRHLVLKITVMIIKHIAHLHCHHKMRLWSSPGQRAPLGRVDSARVEQRVEGDPRTAGTTPDLHHLRAAHRQQQMTGGVPPEHTHTLLWTYKHVTLKTYGFICVKVCVQFQSVWNMWRNPIHWIDSVHLICSGHHLKVSQKSPCCILSNENKCIFVVKCTTV